MKNAFGEDRVVVHFTVLFAIEVQVIMQYVCRLALFPAICRRRNGLATFEVKLFSFARKLQCQSNFKTSQKKVIVSCT